MNGLMMNAPLRITSILRHADRNFPGREIVSVTVDGLVRTTYAEVFARSRRLAHALDRMGLAEGDRVATLAWNDHRHLELYYAIACSGRVCHTINPRLFAEQLVYIVNHAKDRVLFLDKLFVPLVEKLADQLPTVERWVVLTDERGLPPSKLPLESYEALLAVESDTYEWPELHEDAASALCYTSGTTGNPKGVLYSHRSTVLHSYGIAMPDAAGLRARDVILPVVPMFHVNAWGMPYAGPMVGAKLVLPGPKLADGEMLTGLIQREGVTIALGVPTVWLGLLAHLDQTGAKIPSLERTVVGGSACPPSIIRTFRERYGVTTHHAWGMTETSPIGTFNALLAEHAGLEGAERDAVIGKQGRGVFGIEMRIVDEDDREVPWDGQTYGALQVRGPWVASAYYEDDAPGGAFRADGWFHTGDVATIDPHGFMQITDRTKDLVKSGGEWISSIELENIAMGYPGVAEAAVIAASHPKWQERPLLVVVVREGAEVDRQALLDWFQGKVATWWLPDDVAFVAELPHTATGKVSKLRLRQQFAGYVLPTAGETA